MKRFLINMLDTIGKQFIKKFFTKDIGTKLQEFLIKAEYIRSARAVKKEEMKMQKKVTLSRISLVKFLCTKTKYTFEQIKELLEILRT